MSKHKPTRGEVVEAWLNKKITLVQLTQEINNHMKAVYERY